MASKSSTSASSEYFDALRTLCDELSHELVQPLDTELTPTRIKFAKTAELLEHTLTKFVVILSKEKSTSALSSNTTSLTTRLHMLFSLLRCRRTTAGAALAARLQRVGEQVLRGLVTLLDTMEEVETAAPSAAAAPSQSAVASKTGVVLAALKELRQLANSDATAVAVRLREMVTLPKDAAEELAAIRPAKADGDSAAPASQSAVFDGISDDDEAFTPEDYRVVPVCINLCRLARSIMRQALKFAEALEPSAVDESDESGETPDDVAWMQEQLDASKVICEAVDTLGEAVYPPQELESLHAACAAMYESCKAMISRIASYDRAATLAFDPSLRNKKQKKQKKQATSPVEARDEWVGKITSMLDSSYAKLGS